jgi:hypothetical protein
MEFLRMTRSGRARLVWVRCDCGEAFRHTASRPTVACFRCGRTARLRAIVPAGLGNGARFPRPRPRRRTQAAK